MVKKNTCVFISGKGTNLRNLLLKSREYIFPINIRLVISNNKKAKGLNYARKNGIPILIVNTNNRNYESKIWKIWLNSGSSDASNNQMQIPKNF